MSTMTYTILTITFCIASFMVGVAYANRHFQRQLDLLEGDECK